MLVGSSEEAVPWMVEVEELGKVAQTLKVGERETNKNVMIRDGCRDQVGWVADLTPL